MMCLHKQTVHQPLCTSLSASALIHQHVFINRNQHQTQGPGPPQQPTPQLHDDVSSCLAMHHLPQHPHRSAAYVQSRFSQPTQPQNFSQKFALLMQLQEPFLQGPAQLHGVYGSQSSSPTACQRLFITCLRAGIEMVPPPRCRGQDRSRQ